MVALFTNHPKVGDIAAFNQALCGLYAAGLGRGVAAESTTAPSISEPRALASSMPAAVPAAPVTSDRYLALGHMFVEVLDRASEVYRGEAPPPTGLPVTITGASLGLPGTDRIFDDTNVARILRGDQFIDVIPTRFRRAMLDKTHHAPGQERQRRSHV